MMSAYHIVSEDAKRLRLLRAEEWLGTLRFRSRALLQATFALPDGATFEVDKTGFWGSAVEIRQHGNVVLRYDLTWNLGLAIGLNAHDDQRPLSLKKAGTFSSAYQLRDGAGQVLLEIAPEFRWRKMNNDYRISTGEEFEKLAHRRLLLLATMHGMKHLAAMMSVMT